MGPVGAKPHPQPAKKGACTSANSCLCTTALLATIVLVTVALVLLFTVGSKVNTVANKAVVMSEDAQKLMGPVKTILANLTGAAGILDMQMVNNTIGFANYAMKQLMQVNTTELTEAMKRGIDVMAKAVETMEKVDVQGLTNKMVHTVERTMHKGFHIVLGDEGVVKDIDATGEESN